MEWKRYQISFDEMEILTTANSTEAYLLLNNTGSYLLFKNMLRIIEIFLYTNFVWKMRYDYFENDQLNWSFDRPKILSVDRCHEHVIMEHWSAYTRRSLKLVISSIWMDEIDSFTILKLCCFFRKVRVEAFLRLNNMQFVLFLLLGSFQMED